MIEVLNDFGLIKRIYVFWSKGDPVETGYQSERLPSRTGWPVRLVPSQPVGDWNWCIPSRGQSNCDFLKNFLQEKELDRLTKNGLPSQYEMRKFWTKYQRIRTKSPSSDGFQPAHQDTCSNTNIIFSSVPKERRVDVDHQHHIALPLSKGWTNRLPQSKSMTINAMFN